MSMTDMNSPIRIGGLTDEATQAIIAPVQKTLVATKNYAKDDLFIFNNGLYKATANIAANANIVIGTTSGCNANYASTLAEEMNDGIDEFGTFVDLLPYQNSFYKAETDGYLNMLMTSNATGQVQIVVSDSTESSSNAFVRPHNFFVSISEFSNRGAWLFIKKGMRLKNYISSGTGDRFARFYPI